MDHHLRPITKIAFAALIGASVWGVAPASHAQSSNLAQILQKIDPLLSHTGSQGYLGVLVSDVDNDSATKLKLKDSHGALVTLIDHDAPAGQANGLKVNDVVTEINGQKIDAAEQFGRLLKEIPAGRKVTLGILRDGSTASVTLQLVDRKTMEHDVWSQIGKNVDGTAAPSGLAILGASGAGDVPHTGFHMPFFGSTLNVGAMVEPLTPQMSEYLGVTSGILIKEVARKSEAAAAGLRPRDVILKVGAEAINTVADWDRTIRSNEGKAVPVTVLREGKQQTVNLQVDSKHKSEVVFPGLLPDGPCPLMAELAKAGNLEALLGRLNAESFPDLRTEIQVNESDVDQLTKEAGDLARNFSAGRELSPEAFKIDPKMAEEFGKQMDQFQRSFDASQFKIDPKQVEELQRQMKQFQKEFQKNFKFDQKQLNQLRQQVEGALGQRV